MTKPISKNKRQLAQQLIEAGVTQFPEGANWAAQDKGGMEIYCYKNKPHRPLGWESWHHDGCVVVDGEFQADTLIPNWHQTVLSRDEFDQIVAETVVQDEPTAQSPTLDQLLQDWRNADDYAQRKQTEADQAAAMRDERWQAVQARAGEMGVTVGRCESVVVVADPCDLQIGDEVEVVTPNGGVVTTGERGAIVKLTSNGFWCDFPSQKFYWYFNTQFESGDVKFIRRP